MRAALTILCIGAALYVLAYTYVIIRILYEVSKL